MKIKIMIVCFLFPILNLLAEKSLCSKQSSVKTEFFEINFAPALAKLALDKGLELSVTDQCSPENSLILNWHYESIIRPGDRLRRAKTTVEIFMPNGLKTIIEKTSMCFMVECTASDAASSIKKVFKELNRSISKNSLWTKLVAKNLQK